MDTSEYIPWKFTTSLGNTYIYDKYTNMVIPCSEHQYQAICEYQNTNIIPEDSYVHNMINCGLFTNHGQFCDSSGNQEEMFNQLPSTTLILDITEKCNLRCSYCIYGDEYDYCSYSNKQMDFSTARTAVEFLWGNYCKRVERGIVEKPSIIFYGGEPLMNYDIIVKIVNYCHENEYTFLYSITTNATLITKEISKFLVDNYFKIAISLDGDCQETNRRRKYLNGNGAYDDIWNGVENLVSYYKSINRAPELTFNVCFDYASDIKKIMEYFDELENEIGNIFVNMSKIANINTTYYSRFNQREIDNYQQTMNEILRSYLQRQQSGDLKELKKYSLFFQFLQFKSRYTTPITKHCNTCQIGRKMAVTSDGKIYICEKANREISIGDIYEGVNWIAVKSLIDSMNKIRKENCSKCDVSGMCELCYIQFIKNGKLVFDKQSCEEQKNKIRGTIKSCYDVLERIPLAFE